MTILSFERYSPGRKPDELQAVLTEMVGVMRTQPGALWAQVSRALDDDQGYAVLSEWRTTGDLEAWREDGGRAFSDRASPLVIGDVGHRTFTTN